MTTQAEVYRAAHRLVCEYGKKAPVRAALQIDEYRKRGNGGRARLWERILIAVEDVLRERPPSGTFVH